MNEHYLKELKESAEDAEIIDNAINVKSNANTFSNEEIEEFIKRKFLAYSKMDKNNSTKKGNNPKVIKARRKKNKNKKTHRK